MTYFILMPILPLSEKQGKWKTTESEKVFILPFFNLSGKEFILPFFNLSGAEL